MINVAQPSFNRFGNVDHLVSRVKAEQTKLAEAEKQTLISHQVQEGFKRLSQTEIYDNAHARRNKTKAEQAAKDSKKEAQQAKSFILGTLENIDSRLESLAKEKKRTKDNHKKSAAEKLKAKIEHIKRQHEDKIRAEKKQKAALALEEKLQQDYGTLDLNKIIDTAFAEDNPKKMIEACQAVSQRLRDLGHYTNPENLVYLGNEADSPIDLKTAFRLIKNKLTFAKDEKPTVSKMVSRSEAWSEVALTFEEKMKKQNSELAAKNKEYAILSFGQAQHLLEKAKEQAERDRLSGEHSPNNIQYQIQNAIDWTQRVQEYNI